MKIDNKNKLVFIHIPKNAGTSLWGILPGKRDSSLYKHIEYKELVNKIPKIQTFNKLAIVRNPWDRIYSLYSHIVTTHPKIINHYQSNIDNLHKPYHKQFLKWHKEVYNEAMQYGFNDWVMNCNMIWLHDPSKKSLITKPQYEWINDKQNNIAVDIIIKFEEIHTLLKRLNKINIQCNDIPLLNSSIRMKNYRSVYNREARKFVAEKFSIDIETWKYKF